MSTYEEEHPEYLAQRVRDRLARDGRTNELELLVRVAGRKLFVSGTVASTERRDAVTAIAREELPDFEIHNQTTVGDFPAAEEAEHVT